MKRDDDSHSMSNSQFQILSVATSLKIFRAEQSFFSENCGLY